MQRTLLLLTLLAATAAPSIAQVKTGLEVLLEQGDSTLQSQRLGLITNATGVDAAGVPNYQRLLAAGYRIEALFAPEHGFQAREEAGKRIQGSRTQEDIPIYSLYGATKKPTPEMLHALDALLFDIQDIGTRCYTYISTMQLAMEACAEQGKLFVVLDRPNPIAPIAPQGFMLSDAQRSFVGYVKVPFVHSLTVGELARRIQREELPTLQLRVIAMQHFTRTRFADEEIGFRLIPPSPNITSVNAMLLYPALVHLEGTNVSEGRGTDMPFELFGAPFLNAENILKTLRAFQLSGVQFDTVSFVPRSLAGKSSNPKFRNVRCNGIRLTVTDRRAFQPFAVGVAILLALRRIHPNEFQWLDNGRSIDRLAGTPRLRQLIEQQASLSTILAESQASIAAYLRQWRADWLYE